MSTLAPNPAGMKQQLENMGGVWHALDVEEVSLTRQAIDAVKDAAREILPKYVPYSELKSLTVGDSVYLLSRNLFWEEKSGELYLCSDLGEKRYCLHIPAEHWGFKEQPMN